MANSGYRPQGVSHKRFMDLIDEPLSMLTPIRGYENQPLVSLEEAVRPLKQLIPEIEHMVHIAKDTAEKSPQNRLSLDQSAAIVLYTLEWYSKEECVYYTLNHSLCQKDCTLLKPWFLYLKLFFSALSLLPSTHRTVYRGVRGDLRSAYTEGKTIVWWGFSSCTSKIDVLKKEDFLGSAGKRTMFTVECLSGKDIQLHSYYGNENEILLPAARQFRVESVLPQDDGLTMIQLQEVQPKFPLVETSDTTSKIVQPVINPPPGQKIQPVIIQPSNQVFPR